MRPPDSHSSIRTRRKKDTVERDAQVKRMSKLVRKLKKVSRSNKNNWQSINNKKSEQGNFKKPESTQDYRLLFPAINQVNN